MVFIDVDDHLDRFIRLAIASLWLDAWRARRRPVPGTKSYNAQTAETIEKSWFIVDGEDQIVGRIASDIAMVLMGKHKPTYTPNIDTGDFVIVTNC